MIGYLKSDHATHFHVEMYGCMPIFWCMHANFVISWIR